MPFFLPPIRSTNDDQWTWSATKELRLWVHLERLQDAGVTITIDTFVMRLQFAQFRNDVYNEFIFGIDYRLWPIRNNYHMHNTLDIETSMITTGSRIKQLMKILKNEKINARDMTVILKYGVAIIFCS